MKDIINHPTRVLLRMCGWVSERVNENVMIGIFCVGALIAVFARL